MAVDETSGSADYSSTWYTARSFGYRGLKLHNSPRITVRKINEYLDIDKIVEHQ